jgi:uncharacterized protein (TIGR04255 family)
MSKSSKKEPAAVKGQGSGALDSICYEKSFLKEVVVRLDLLSPITAVAKKVPDKIFQVAVKRFPIPEKKLLEHHQVTITKGKPKVAKSSGPACEWLFHSKDRKRTLCLSERYVWIKEIAYTRYEDLRQDFLSVLEQIESIDGTPQPKRLGLRYINVVDDQMRDWGGWKKMIQPTLVVGHEILSPEEEASFAGSLTTFELTAEDSRLRFIFGQFNPNQPAASMKTQFVLDVDVFSDDVEAISDVKASLDLFHARAQSVFERSITSELRKRMKAASAGG